MPHYSFPFDPSKLAPLEIKQIKGVDVKVSFSPYDVPVSVNIEELGEIGIVTFEYLGSEPLVSSQLNRYTKVFFGQHSDRIYKIEIDLKSVRNETSGVSFAVASAARKAIASVAKEKPMLAQRYGVVQRGLELAQIDLSKDMASASEI